jgi:site-specific DNA recombinase
MEDTRRAETVRCAIYARYSSDLQRPASIEDQNRKCMEECHRHEGWTVVDEWVVADRAQSGASTAGRDALNSLKQSAKRDPRPFDCIVIDDTSRLGRNLGDVLKLADTFQHYGVFLHFVSPPLDSRNREIFRQMLIFQGMMDERYLGDLRHKVRRGAEGRVLKKYLPGGRCYGYKNVPVEDPSRRGEYGRPAVIGVQLEIIDSEAEVIREIFRLHADGNSLSAIAKSLNSRGIDPPDSGKKRRRPHGWSFLSIRDMLRRDKYRGVHKWGKRYEVRDPETGQKQWRHRPENEVVTIAVPEWQIVPDDLWNKVQSEIKRRNHFGTKRIGGFNRTEQSKKYLFSGLLRCVCGRSMTIVSGSGSSMRYGCPEHRNNGVCNNNLTIRRDRLEEQLLGFLVGGLLRPEMLEYALTSFDQQLQVRLNELRKPADEKSKLRDERAKLTSEAENIAQAIADSGHRQSPTLLSLLQKIESQIAELDKRLNVSVIATEVSISKAAMKEFALKKAHDLNSVLRGDPLLAKQTLRKHIKQLLLTPKETPTGAVFEVTGDLDLFAGGIDALQSVLGEGYAQHCTLPLSLTGFQLNPNTPVRNRPTRAFRSSEKPCVLTVVASPRISEANLTPTI